ncbi:MAG: SagB/ThcOx family dehydrogenase [Bacteroidales bacterium]|nr:SagB/ThcOx family dehydrogenase [Bacteroidales bacterium]
MKKMFSMAIISAFCLGVNAQTVRIQQSITPTSEDSKVINLPKPRKEGGKPLMNCLNERKSIRKFSEKPLDLQVLADLLWASYGISREDGRRTAPTARNAQDISIYVVMESGIYLWESTKNVLILIEKGDFRKETGPQEFVPTAQWNIAIVSDLSKYGDVKDVAAVKYGAMSAGYVSENMYLYCASCDLATVARGMFNPEVMNKLLRLNENEMVMLIHSVGMMSR